MYLTLNFQGIQGKLKNKKPDISCELKKTISVTL